MAGRWRAGGGPVAPVIGFRAAGRQGSPKPIPGSDQVVNSAKGYTWAVDDWVRLRRFLILGVDGGSYYATESRLVKENATAVLRCLAQDGPRTVA
ncbi:MAG: hypothetical protein ACT4OS_10095 [Acidimicrobiales bacterium]